jgi:dephospho-CoA kinase
MTMPEHSDDSRPGEMPVIGVVGGVGSGKSVASAEFGRLGCVVVDADALGHDVLEEPAVRQQLDHRWGETIFGPDGTADRAAIATIVFARPEELDWLTGICWPRIRRRMEQTIERARRNRAVGVVLDAAVLFEAGWDSLCTHTVLVACPRALRLQRLRENRGWNEAQFDRREQAQISLDTKRGWCCHVLQNSSSASHLCEQVRDVFHQILRRQ